MTVRPAALVPMLMAPVSVLMVTWPVDDALMLMSPVPDRSTRLEVPLLEPTVTALGVAALLPILIVCATLPTPMLIVLDCAPPPMAMAPLPESKLRLEAPVVDPRVTV